MAPSPQIGCKEVQGCALSMRLSAGFNIFTIRAMPAPAIRRGPQQVSAGEASVSKGGWRYRPAVRTARSLAVAARCARLLNPAHVAARGSTAINVAALSAANE
jgi:hypothetical protein